MTTTWILMYLMMAQTNTSIVLPGVVIVCAIIRYINIHVVVIPRLLGQVMHSSLPVLQDMHQLRGAAPVYFCSNGGNWRTRQRACLWRIFLLWWSISTWWGRSAWWFLPHA